MATKPHDYGIFWKGIAQQVAIFAQQVAIFAQQVAIFAQQVAICLIS